MAQLLQMEFEFVFQFVTGVIGAHRNSHKKFPLKTVVAARKMMLNVPVPQSMNSRLGAASPKLEIVPN
jgi:hypothetical protein